MTSIYVGGISAALKTHILKSKPETRKQVLVMVATLGADESLARITYTGPKMPTFSALEIGRRLEAFDVESDVAFDADAVLGALAVHLFNEGEEWLDGLTQADIDEICKTELDNESNL